MTEFGALPMTTQLRRFSTRHADARLHAGAPKAGRDGLMPPLLRHAA